MHYNNYTKEELVTLCNTYKSKIDYLESIKINVDLNDVSKRNAKGYAEFCVICDRGKLPLLELDDYIKLYG